MKKITLQLLALGLLVNLNTLLAQEDSKKDSLMEFNILAETPTTVVKNQYKSGTCWSFAATSFLESEIFRNTGKKIDLSEMFFVRHAYTTKAGRYVRMHGKTNFGPGGQAHDVMDVVSQEGLLTEDAYSGLPDSSAKHIHGEMDAVLHGMLNTVIKKRNKEAPIVWPVAYEYMLDTYLGEVPEEVEYESKTYTPLELKKALKINASNYIEITSFTHHPFYSSFSLEVPDNWSNSLYYNIPLEELIFIIEYSLRNGYSVVWDGDVGHKGFQYKKGTATVHEEDDDDEEEDDDGLIKVDPDVMGACKPEIFITQELRQEMFDKLISTDDHLMHITALVEGPSGKYYFKTKNSWAESSNDYDGYIYMTEAYLKLNTIAIMVHKGAIHSDLAKKLGIK